MTTIRYGDHEPHPLTVSYPEVKRRPLTGPDRPLELDQDPARWPHPSTLTYDQSVRVGMAPAWVREALGAEIGAWHGAQNRSLSAEHERLVRDAAQEGRGRIVMSTEASRKRQRGRQHADAWATLLNVDVDGVQELRMGIGG